MAFGERLKNYDWNKKPSEKLLSKITSDKPKTSTGTNNYIPKPTVPQINPQSSLKLKDVHFFVKIQHHYKAKNFPGYLDIRNGDELFLQPANFPEGHEPYYNQVWEIISQ